MSENDKEVRKSFPVTERLKFEYQPKPEEIPTDQQLLMFLREKALKDLAERMFRVAMVDEILTSQFNDQLIPVELHVPLSLQRTWIRCLSRYYPDLVEGGLTELMGCAIVWEDREDIMAIFRPAVEPKKPEA
jgi:hypothetical protein